MEIENQSLIRNEKSTEKKIKFFKPFQITLNFQEKKKGELEPINSSLIKSYNHKIMFYNNNNNNNNDIIFNWPFWKCFFFVLVVDKKKKAKTKKNFLTFWHFLANVANGCWQIGMTWKLFFFIFLFSSFHLFSSSVFFFFS